MDDLNEAIVLDRVALSLHPLGHPDRSTPLINLAALLSSQYKQLWEMNDLHDAIILGQEALLLCPPGHADCSTSLINLAAHLTF